MTPDILAQAAQLGVGGLLAVIVFYFYRDMMRSHTGEIKRINAERLDNEKQRTQDAKDWAQQERADKLMLLETFKENTQAINNNTMVISDLKQIVTDIARTNR